MTLYIREVLAEDVIKRCVDSDIEACGLLAGWKGTDYRPTRIIPMRNVENSRSRFSFSEGQQMMAFAEMKDRDEEPVAVYHSHLFHEAYPSDSDIANHHYPDMHYLIVSLADGTPHLRSFKIRAGEVEEENIVYIC